MPPSTRPGRETAIRLDAQQAVEYAFVPIKDDTDDTDFSSSGESRSTSVWYQGDIYDYASSPSGKGGLPLSTNTASKSVSNLARSITLPAGEYVMLISAIYEIRMFGDPQPHPPTIRFRVTMEVDELEDVEAIHGLAVVPDIVDGRLMGDWMSVPLRVAPHVRCARVINVDTEKCRGDGIRVGMGCDAWMAVGGQTRPLALRIRQSRAQIHLRKEGEIRFDIQVDVNGRAMTLSVRTPVSSTSLKAARSFRITFPSPSEPYPGSMPSLVSYATVVPPPPPSHHHDPSSSGPLGTSSSSHRKKPPVILALHGAGVDIDNPFWADAIPPREDGWAVLPQGKTEWGEDWHGGSMADAWASRDALEGLATRLGIWVSKETL